VTPSFSVYLYGRYGLYAPGSYRMVADVPHCESMSTKIACRSTDVFHERCVKVTQAVLPAGRTGPVGVMLPPLTVAVAEVITTTYVGATIDRSVTVHTDRSVKVMIVGMVTVKGCG